MVRRVFSLLFLFFVGILGGILGSEILWPFFVERPLFYQYDLGRPPVFITERKEIIIRENEAIVEAIEKIKGSVVAIGRKKGNKVLGGSGLFLTSEGLLITLASLLPQEAKLLFYWENKVFAYEILKRDLRNNLALVKLEGKDFPTFSFRENPLKLGERFFLVGKSLENKTIQLRVNEGIIKKINKDFFETNIQDSPLLNGSPCFDIEGKIIGIAEIDEAGKVKIIPITLIRKFSNL